MSFKRTYDGPWNRRIYDLMGAMGWGVLEAAKKLGFAGRLPLNRILKGGKPKVSFLLQLQKLEVAYAGEIQEFIRQRRPFKKFARKRRDLLRQRSYGDTSSTRAADLAEMGDVAAFRPSSGAGVEPSSEPPSRVVYWTDPRRYKRKNNKVGGDGPPAIESGRPG